MIDLNRLSHIHFVGIGGIGTSAIARMMLGRGLVVSGSDRAASAITDRLTADGAHISIGQAPDTVLRQCDAVVHTVAIPPENPELVEARRRGIPLLTYPEMLELVSAEKYTIAVAGTHGKTTTTAMLGSILLAAGADPTVLVGGLMLDPRHQKITDQTFEQSGVNFILGDSKYFVVEADEYKKSFLHLSPRLLVITNIDADHLDFYKDLGDIQATFAELVGRVPADGAIICNSADPHVAPICAAARAPIIDYRRQEIPQLTVPGQHNRYNAMAAAAAAGVLGISSRYRMQTLQNFPGTWRRFQYKGVTPQGAIVYDDYAHNPQKVAAAITGARELYPDRRIVAVFQPHLYSRTKHFLPEFANALVQADAVVLLPIYAAREANDQSISSDMLAQKITLQAPAIRAIVRDSFAAAKKYLDQELTAGDVVLVMGAGDSTQLATLLVQ